jgi:triacylglycerol lipase
LARTLRPWSVVGPDVRIALVLLGLTACAPVEPDASEDLQTKEDFATAVDEGKADWASDFCESRGWYGDGECDWYCTRRDPDCDVSELFTRSQGQGTAYPIVLAHGFNATGKGTFDRVARALEGAGFDVTVAEVPSFGTVAERASRLGDFVDRALSESGAEKVNLIAHSMGGLDARYLISRLGYAPFVASLTTLGTPHRGSFVADVALGATGIDLEMGWKALASVVGRRFDTEEQRSVLRRTLVDLSEEQAPAFNARTQDAVGVYYQSWAGVSSVIGVEHSRDEHTCETYVRHPGTTDRTDRALRYTAPLASRGTLDPADGMVLVESAKWGDFRGCVPADHIDLTRSAGDPDTGFGAPGFFLELAFDLADRGY